MPDIATENTVEKGKETFANYNEKLILANICNFSFKMQSMTSSSFHVD